MHVHFAFETVASLSQHAVRCGMSPGAQSNRPLGGRGLKSQPGFQKTFLPGCGCLMAKGWCKFLLANTYILLRHSSSESLEKSTYWPEMHNVHVQIQRLLWVHFINQNTAKFSPQVNTRNTQAGSKHGQWLKNGDSPN